MSTKTIAVDVGVYHRLAAIRREGESFSRLIDRLLTEVGDAHTGAEILDALEGMEALPTEDAEIMLRVIAEDRENETWPAHDLR